MSTFSKELKSARHNRLSDSDDHARSTDSASLHPMLHLQQTIGNQAVMRTLQPPQQAAHVRLPNALVILRQPEDKPAEAKPSTKQKTLNDEGVLLDDPVSANTAQLIDAALQRNQRLAPYIGDRLKSGFRIAEKGKFVHEMSDGNFENAYRSAYELGSGETVPPHVTGFYDPRKSEVHLRPTAKFGTALHEAIHRLASPALYQAFLPTANQISKNLTEVLKEGMTAFFTDGILSDEKLPNFNDAYRGAKTKVESLIKTLGADGFDLVAKFNFKGAGLVEIGNKLGLSTKQYFDLKGEGPAEVLKRINKAL